MTQSAVRRGALGLRLMETLRVEPSPHCVDFGGENGNEDSGVMVRFPCERKADDLTAAIPSYHNVYQKL